MATVFDSVAMLRMAGVFVFSAGTRWLRRSLGIDVHAHPQGCPAIGRPAES
jgi:hypothetical protein